MHMDHVGGLLVDGVRDRLRPDLRIHVATAEVEFWATPDFSLTAMPSPVPPGLRSVAGRFLEVYRSRLRVFEAEYEVAPRSEEGRVGTACVRPCRSRWTPS